MPATKKVTLAADYTDEAGKNHKADASPTLPRHEANTLLAAGLARLPEDGGEASKPPTIPEILAEVGEDKDKAAAALEAERSGKNRPSLIEKLEAIVNTEEN